MRIIATLSTSSCLFFSGIVLRASSINLGIFVNIKAKLDHFSLFTRSTSSYSIVTRANKYGPINIRAIMFVFVCVRVLRGKP